MGNKDGFLDIDYNKGTIRAFRKDFYITDTQRSNIQKLVPKLLLNPKAKITIATVQKIASSLLSLEFTKSEVRLLLKPHKLTFEVTDYKHGYIIEILQKYYGSDCLYEKIEVEKRREYKSVRKQLFNSDNLIDEDFNRNEN